MIIIVHLHQNKYQSFVPEEISKERNISETEICFQVREQLSAQDSQSNGRILDLKTGTVKKEGSQSAMRLCMGSRRGFIARIKVDTTHRGGRGPGSGWNGSLALLHFRA